MTTRREVLGGAAGLAISSTLFLPAPARADVEPFRIEPSTNYLELKRLSALINESHHKRYWSGDIEKAEAKRLNAEFYALWDEIKPLLDAMSAQPPITPSALLDYAAVMLWHSTSLGSGLTTDPCAALADATEWTTRRQYNELRVAWGIFALAADRSEPAAPWPEHRPLLRDGPGCDI